MYDGGVQNRPRIFGMQTVRNYLLNDRSILEHSARHGHAKALINLPKSPDHDFGQLRQFTARTGQHRARQRVTLAAAARTGGNRLEKSGGGMALAVRTTSSRVPRCQEFMMLLTSSALSPVSCARMAAEIASRPIQCPEPSSEMT